MPINLPVQSLQQLSADGARQTDVRAELAAGRTLDASVREVTPDPQRPNLFRIKVEVQRQLMELLTTRPLNSGAQISLSQDAGGKVQLTLLSTQPRPQSSSPTPQQRAQPQAPILQLRVPPQSQSQSQSQNSLAQLLPIGETQLARVIPSTNANTSTGSQQTPALAEGQNSQPPTTRPATPATSSSSQSAAAGNTQSDTAQPSSTPSRPTTGTATNPEQQPASTTPRTPTPAAADTSNRATQTQVPPANNEQPRPQQPTVQERAPVTSSTADKQPQNPRIQAPITPVSTQESAPSTPKSTSPQAAPTAPTPAPPQPTAGASSTTPREQPSPSTSSREPTSNPPLPTPSPNPAAQSSKSGTAPATAATATTSTSTTTATNQTAVASQTPVAPQTPPASQASTAPQGASGQVIAANADNIRVSMSVNGQTLELISPRPLQPGLEVQLTRTSDNQIQLQLAPPRNDNGAQLKLQEGLQQILRDNLPQQLPAGDALNQMRQIPAISRPGGDAVAQVIKSMLSLFSVAPKTDAKTTQQVVQNHLQSSGLISQPRTTPTASQRELPPLQQQLGKLTDLADQLPPQAREQMLTLVKGLQARTASHQATSLQNWQEMPDGSLERQYRLDLPIRLERDRLEDSEIHIQQRKKPDEEGRFVSLWSIQLHFDREELGPVDAHVSLQQEWQLSARFWAEREETTRLIKAQLDGFQQQLGASGFEVEALQVQRGKPPRDTRSPVNHRLVDLHT